MAVRSFQVMLDWDLKEQLWVSYVPALDFLSTYGDTKEETIENTRDAILGYLEAAAKEGLQVPDGPTATQLVSIDIQVA